MCGPGLSLTDPMEDLPGAVPPHPWAGSGTVALLGCAWGWTHNLSRHHQTHHLVIADNGWCGSEGHTWTWECKAQGFWPGGPVTWLLSASHLFSLLLSDHSPLCLE